MPARPARRIVDILFHPHYHRWDFWRSRCNICGHATIFLCTERRERWIRFCLFCRSTPKYRALYHALTCYLGVGLGARLDKGAGVYELTAASPIYRCFRRYAGYSRSVYLSDRPFGIEIKPRVWNQDVQRLTFPNASFDVVISSETMEHVRKPWIGFAEIHRVLKPGGVHCFTIPYRKDRLTRSRVDTSGAEDVYVLPKVYHEDPYCVADSLVYTEFGSDLIELLRPFGFETTECSVVDRASDIQDDLGAMRVFLSVKR